MNHTDFAFDRVRYDADVICAPCKGSGKRGRGECRECSGAGIAHLDSPRVRFNWGYHDARADVRREHPRAITSTGPHTPQIVSVEYNRWYAAGYAFGLRDAKVATTTSEPAWIEWAGFPAVRAA